MKKFPLLILIAILSFGCSVQTNQPTANTTTLKPENVSVANIAPAANKTVENKVETTEPKKAETTDNSACYKLTRDDLMVDEKQTFAIDFKPFEKSCFVTFHDPEFDNPPLGSRFFIYKSGKESFEFPDQFGMGNTTCWVDAVAFEDLNGDQLKDVVIIGKCGAKSSSFNENMVYLNNGTEFVTNADSNAELMDFSRVSQIRDFVKKNPKMFAE